MEILAAAQALERQGRDVIHLEIGQPDFPAPDAVRSAAIACIERGHVGYTPAAGIPELRRAIADEYGRRHGIEVSASRVIVTPGASGALALVFGLILSDRGRVLLTDPGYPCHAQIAQLVGGQVSVIPVDQETRFHLDAERIGRFWGPDCVACMLASPSNPTGTVIPPLLLREVAEALRERRGLLVSDEIYHGLEHHSDSASALSFDADAYVINSFSKFYGMTGWRVGWAVVPEQASEHAERLAQNLFICAPAPSQFGALAALSEECRPELERRRDEFRGRCERLASGLKDIGFDVPINPDAAFYVYADASEFGPDSRALASRLLHEAGVAVTPGSDFGAYRAERYLRFSCVATTARIDEALQRIRRCLHT